MVVDVDERYVPRYVRTVLRPTGYSTVDSPLNDEPVGGSNGGALLSLGRQVAVSSCTAALRLVRLELSRLERMRSVALQFALRANTFMVSLALLARSLT
jgi:hypothetical protein